MKCIVSQLMENLSNDNLPVFNSLGVTFKVLGDGVCPVIQIETNVPNATIYYTIDGTTPSAASTVYSAPFNVESSCVVRAIAISASVTSDVESVGVTYDAIKSLIRQATITSQSTTETFNVPVYVGDVIAMTISSIDFETTDPAKNFDIFLDRSNYTKVLFFRTQTSKSSVKLFAVVTTDGLTGNCDANANPVKVAATTLLRFKTVTGYSSATANVKLELYRKTS